MEERNITLRNFKLEPLKTDYRVTREYRTQLVKLSSELTCEDMVPITYDVMFKTSLQILREKNIYVGFFRSSSTLVTRKPRSCLGILKTNSIKTVSIREEIRWI